MSSKAPITALLAGLLAVAITACGGSSSSVTAPPVDKPPVPEATAPSITTQPQKISVVAGKTATFSVVATGSATLAYQWKKNGTNINSDTCQTHALLGTFHETTRSNNFELKQFSPAHL